MDYKFKPKIIESHLTNFIVYDLETHNIDRARLYIRTFYRLSKLPGKYNCDLTPYEIEKCNGDTLVFDGDECVKNASDFFLKFKGEEPKNIKIVNSKIVGNYSQLHAHNGSGFDTWIILNNLPCYKHIVDNNKNGKGICCM